MNASPRDTQVLIQHEVSLGVQRLDWLPLPS